MHDEGGLPLTLTFLLMTKGMSVIGKDPEPRSVGLSPTKTSAITSEGSEARLTRVWEAML